MNTPPPHAGRAQLALPLLVWLTLSALVDRAGGARPGPPGSCLFPERWEGSWFQSGVRQPIVIEGPRLSSKGVCLGAEGDKFLVVDDKRVCYRCVVIHEKHANVLQYKETFCHGRESLPTLCSLITGDALLYSMFREGALPVPCPFRGPFTFTYNRGHGECRAPVSTVDQCSEDSRLLLSYQACPDVYGTESTVEELECLATWKEGSSRYLVGKVHHSHATSNEDRFRCFVYERTGIQGSSSTGVSGGGNVGVTALGDVDYRVAQSGDATCNGLFSATEGSRTMTLRKAPSANRCRYPTWLSVSQHWHTLDYTSTYSFHHRNATLRVTNSTSGSEMKVVCHQLRPPAGSPQAGHREESPAMLLAHYTMGCQSGYKCMLFYRRDSHVVEVQTGADVRRPEDACSPANFNRRSLPYVTLVTTSPEPRQCPYMGKFSVAGLAVGGDQGGGRTRRRHTAETNHLDTSGGTTTSQGASGRRTKHPDETPDFLGHRSKRLDKPPNSEAGGSPPGSSGNGGRHPCAGTPVDTLVVGCSNVDSMEFYAECGAPEVVSSYSCHGRWEENGTHYLITTPLSRASHGARRYCFIYREGRNLPADVGTASEDSAEMVVHFSSSSDGCDRGVRPGVEGGLVFNATSVGKCVETSAATTGRSRLADVVTFALLALRLAR